MKVVTDEISANYIHMSLIRISKYMKLVHDRAAPGAKLAFADIGDKLGWIYLPPYEELLATGHPYAKVHSMSWGADINSYTAETKIFDGENCIIIT